ncbi:MAG TPA: type I pullulanase [Chthoniobacterales bacterium]
MIFECPYCSQSLEIDNSWANETIDCPKCHQPVIVPDPAAEPSQPDASSTPTASKPPMYVPLQPLAPGSAKLIKKRKGLGCGGFLSLLFVVVVGGFGYAMYRHQESPRETWNRLETMARELFQEKQPIELNSEPEEIPEPTVRPDAIAWLMQHKNYWPKQVILLRPVDFPAISAGKKVGSLVVPSGSRVTVINIEAGDVETDFMGGRQRVPIVATDLRVRADAALGKAEFDAQAGPGRQEVAQLAPEKEREPELTREASREEIRTGLGAMYTRRATTFRVFAPNSKSVSVILYDKSAGGDGRMVCSLKQQGNNLWDITVQGDLHGKFYTLLLDENDPKRKREVLDPYATNSVANSSRGRITPMTRAVAPGPQLASATDAIVYEMHVRDFTISPSSGVTNAGLYAGWTESGTRLPNDAKIETALDHLTELGVTHVELMPVQDFQNDEASRRYNWGYVTSDFFSPEGMFASNPDDDSRVRELKALITELHSRGIGVILDVVYNHTADNSSLMSIAQDYYYRRAPNGSLANGSGCGNEFKSEAPMARRLILDSLKFWATEYGVDGFRFDLMALIDQETIRQADRELRKIKPGILLFGEPWTGGTTPLREKTDKTAIRQVPAGAFNDDFRNALKGSPDHDDGGWIQNGSKRDALKSAMLISDWYATPGQSINYMTCHDNLVLWDKLVQSMPDANDALRIETMKLGYLALFTSQGVPFIHGGEEFARTKGGNNNSYESPDSVNEVDWGLKREHLDLFNYVRDLMTLHKAHPLFRLRSRADVRSRVQFIDPPDRASLMFTVNGEGVPGETWKRACVALNSSDQKDSEMSLPGGAWLVAADADGAVASPQIVSGKITLRHKSGVVLYQK